MKTNLDLARECGAVAIPCAIQEAEGAVPMAVFFQSEAQLDAFAERVRANERVEFAAKVAATPALPGPMFKQVAPGIEVGYDMWGGVDIRLGGEFVYVHIDYDHRYTHNLARKTLADNIVRLLVEGWPKEPVQAQAGGRQKPSIHAGSGAIGGDQVADLGPGEREAFEVWARSGDGGHQSCSAVGAHDSTRHYVSHATEAAFAAWQARAALAASQPGAPAVPEFTDVATRKLAGLQASGLRINGYALQAETPGGVTRCFISHGGFVGWWSGPEAYRQLMVEQAMQAPERRPLDAIGKAALELVLRHQRLPLADGVLKDDVYPLLTALEAALIEHGITGDGQ